MHAKREIQRTDSDREEKRERIQGHDRGVEAKAEADLEVEAKAEADLEVGHIAIIVIIAITRVEEDNTREYGKRGCFVFVGLKCFDSMESLCSLTSSVCRRAFYGIARTTGRRVKDSV